MSENKAEPLTDPLVDEVRAIRESILARFDYDLRKYFDYLRELEKQHAARIATQTSRTAEEQPPAC